MRGTIAVTDLDWYDFLRARALPEVNFWKPSARRPFTAPQFSPFFFKLKAPRNVIGGFGYFARWTTLPDWLAWECFGQGNGCAALAELRERLADIRARIGYVPEDSLGSIGCVLIVQPTFFAPDDWVAQPDDWHARTVSSKSYDLERGEGLRIWQCCLERAGAGATPALGNLPFVAEELARYGTPRLVAPRLGQGTFRVAVTDAYARACAVTGEHSLPVLEAAHVLPYANGGPHDVQNGVLLRSDLHRLFDQGYITITPELRLEVSPRLRTDYSNGRSYYPLQNTALHVPASAQERPAPEFLRWHNDRVYLG